MIEQIDRWDSDENVQHERIAWIDEEAVYEREAAWLDDPERVAPSSTLTSSPGDPARVVRWPGHQPGPRLWFQPSVAFQLSRDGARWFLSWNVPSPSVTATINRRGQLKVAASELEKLDLHEVGVFYAMVARFRELTR